jgi:hypothetical protein
MRSFYINAYGIVTLMPAAGQRVDKNIPEAYALNNYRTSIAM